MITLKLLYKTLFIGLMHFIVWLLSHGTAKNWIKKIPNKKSIKKISKHYKTE